VNFEVVTVEYEYVLIYKYACFKNHNKQYTDNDNMQVAMVWNITKIYLRTDILPNPVFKKDCYTLG